MTAILSPAKKAYLKKVAPRKSLLSFMRLVDTDYVASRVHAEICHKVQAFYAAVERGDSPRLMIFMPPRLGKSYISTIGFPAWTLGNHPEWDVVTLSYGDKPAKRFARHIKRIQNSKEYKELFPSAGVYKGPGATNSVDMTEFEEGGSLNASSVGAALTGMGAKIMVIDDPVKDSADADSEVMREKIKDWYLTTARTRINKARGGILILNTRWHEDDLAGWILHDAKEGLKRGDKYAKQWDVVNYAALATEDEKYRKKGESICEEILPTHELMAMKGEYLRAGRERWWNAMFQQNPIPDEGTYFKRPWILDREDGKNMLYVPGKYAKSEEDAYDGSILPPNLNCYVASDYAFGKKKENDFTCIWAFGIDEYGETWFLPSYWYGKGNTFEVIQKTYDIADEVKAQIIFTEKGKDYLIMEPYLEQENMDRLLNDECDTDLMYLWETTPNTEDKRAKARPAQGRVKAGLVHFPDNEFFWEHALPEMMKFDQGTHDDIVDTVAIANMPLTFQVASQPIEREGKKAAKGTHEEFEAREAWEEENKTQISRGRSRFRPNSKHRPKNFNSQR